MKSSEDSSDINGARYFRLKSRHENYIFRLIDGIKIIDQDATKFMYSAAYDAEIINFDEETDYCVFDSIVGLKVYDKLDMILCSAHGSLEPVTPEEEHSLHFQQMLKDVFE